MFPSPLHSPADGMSPPFKLHNSTEDFLRGSQVFLAIMLWRSIKYYRLECKNFLVRILYVLGNNLGNDQKIIQTNTIVLPVITRKSVRLFPL